MKTKDEYIESLSSELKEWSAQIDNLTARAENSAAELKFKYAEELDGLRSNQQAQIKQLKELEYVSGVWWETAKKEWNAQITTLTARAESTAVELKFKYAEELDGLRSKQHAVTEKLIELEYVNGDVWETVKKTAYKVCMNLNPS